MVCSIFSNKPDFPDFSFFHSPTKQMVCSGLTFSNKFRREQTTCFVMFLFIPFPNKNKYLFISASIFHQNKVFVRGRNICSVFSQQIKCHFFGFDGKCVNKSSILHHIIRVWSDKTICFVQGFPSNRHL